MTGAPELALSEPEAKSLTVAIGNVARHYSPKVAQKWADWSALVTCLGAVYGPRAYLIAERRRAEREPAPGAAPNGFAGPEAAAVFGSPGAGFSPAH